MTDEARLSFYDMFDTRRISGVAWPAIIPGELSEEKHVWLYNRRDASPGSTTTRLRVCAKGFTPAGEEICLSNFVEARSDGIAGSPEGPFIDDAQDEFTPIGGSLLAPGDYLGIGDIPPLGGRRIIFRLNIPPWFTTPGPVVLHLMAGYREG